MKKTLIKIKTKIAKRTYEKKKKMNLKRVSKITGLKVPKEYKKLLKTPISEVSVSVKDLKPNCIIFTIKYNNFTEADFERIRKNALFVVGPKPISGCNNIVVADTDIQMYGTKILNYIRNLSKIKVIAVTGSVGKTSTKEMIESVLKEKYKGNMIVSIGNSNSLYKSTVNLKKITFTDKVFLQEVGAGANTNDMVKNTALVIEPDIAIYTNIRDSHIEWYGSRENIAKEKFTLSDFGKKDGLAIINYDDEILRKHKFIQKTLSYSLKNKKANYYAKNIIITSAGTKFIIVDNILNKEFSVKMKQIGEHYVLNSLVAYIVGKQLGLKNKAIYRGLNSYKTSGIRQNLINVGKYKVLADCYNSSFDALSNILKTVDILETKNNGRKIAVIGDIFELGRISIDVHKKVGIVLAEHNLDKVIFQGENVKFSYEEYKKIKDNAIYCETREELLKVINKTIKQDDLILFKASHGMHFASVIDSLFGLDVGEISALGHKEYETFKNNEFTYKVFSNHATISKYNGKNSKIVLSDKYNNLPIEKIYKGLFKKNKIIKEITLSKNMIRLGALSFKQSSLEKINFNKTLKAIGPGTFNGCENLKEAILPDKLLMIEYRAFANCPKLSKVYIPNSTMKISSQAFINSNKVIIECDKNSYALKYAIKNNIKYKISDRRK